MGTKFVFFDLGNVLVNFDHEIAVRQLAALTERTDTHVRNIVFKSGLQNRYESGLVSSQEFTSIVNRELQCNHTSQEILEAVSAIFQRNESILKALELLRTRHLSMGILSNTCEAHWQWLERQAWPMLDGWFEARILSYQVGSMKPDALIYEHCEQAIGRQGAEIFFMDDRIENVEAAAQRGWVARQYRQTDELLEQLNKWLQESSA